MKGIFLGACLQRHKDCSIDYNDIDPKTNCNIICDMLEVDLSNYDYLLATPPCNYYSRANYRRETSFYAQQTKHLLPSVLEKFAKIGKPFLVENVRNNVIMKQMGIFDIVEKYHIQVYYCGRHIYFSNIELDLSQVPQAVDNIQSKSYKGLGKNYRQGGLNVWRVFQVFLDNIGATI